MLTMNPSENHKARTVGFWDSKGILAHMVEKEAERRGQTTSEFLEGLVTQYLDEYVDSEMSEERKEWLQVKRKERREQLFKDIAKDQKKDNTFKHFIKEQIYHQKMMGASREDINKWLDKQEEIFKIRGLDKDTLEYYKENQDELAQEYSDKFKRTGENEKFD